MNEPQISISTCFDYSMPVDIQLPLISRAGFTHVSLGQDTEHSGILDKKRRETLEALLKTNHLKIDTIHGISLCYPDSAEKMKPIIEAGAALGAPVVVAHPIPFDIGQGNYDDLLSKILASLHALEPLLKDTGIRLAVENVLPGPSTGLAIEAVRRCDSNYIGFCYDSSHEQADGPNPLELLRTMKDRVIAVHLSDWVKPFTDHVPPREGVIDWPELSSQLRDTSFPGPLLFEVTVEHTSVKETEPFLRLVYEKAVWVNSLVGR